MWQAEHVRDQLRSHHDNLDVEIMGVTTQADKFLNQSLSEMGGKGAFVKELEQALLDGSADIAVHSMKDVPIDLPRGLSILACLARETVLDAFVSNSHESFDDLPTGAVIGTSSLRRRSQIKALRPDLEVRDIRGNVGTRLDKLDRGDFDALVLASAGLIRLGLGNRIVQSIPVDQILPAVGQGALGIEARTTDERVKNIISILDDEYTRTCLEAERAVSRELNGGCHAPLAAHATLDNNSISITAMVGNLTGEVILKKSIEGNSSDATLLGGQLAGELLADGAGEIIKAAVEQ